MKQSGIGSGIALLVLAGAVAGAENGVPEASAHRVDETVSLDGLLAEPVWSRVPPIGRLLQQEPKEGADPFAETEVRVIYDENNLYFGILCRDPAPASIVATQLGRDANFDVDDRIVIVLDTFFDQRNGFFFEVNPAGARSDGQVANNAEQRNREWDGIWDAGARVTAEGWSAEIAIPFKTLRFKPGQTTWGLNVERSIKRLNEVDRWASPRRQVWLTNFAMAGRVTRLEGLRQGRGVDIRPYVSGGDENSDAQFDVGVDLFKSVTPGLNASVTVNTDFAETEVDTRQVNLTRFPLFFPEKRAFFLEGSGVFEVAGLRTGGESPVIPFFSRRIGLLEGEEVPILVGGKLAGREHGFNVGFLDVQTRDDEGQNLLAARVSRNLFRQSWVGGIVTHGNPEGTGGNTLLGADARFQTSTFRGNKNFSLDLYFLHTSDEATEASDTAFGFTLDYPNERWDAYCAFSQVGKEFQPALGFVPRSGIRELRPGLAFRPRAPQIGVRRFNFELMPEVVTDLDNRVLNWRVFTAPLNLRTESAEHIEWNYVPEFERLDVPFEIYPGVVIPPGDYRWTRYRFELNTATKRPWVVDFFWWWGGFYSGTRRDLSFGITLKPSRHLSLQARAERNDVSLVEGAFYTQILRLRVDYSVSANVSWSTLAQYDNASRVLGIQSRFRWILKPGNDLFLVVNRGWTDFDDKWLPAFDKGTVKFQYTFRL